jgi:hypothetical protein
MSFRFTFKWILAVCSLNGHKIDIYSSKFETETREYRTLMRFCKELANQTGKAVTKGNQF